MISVLHALFRCATRFVCSAATVTTYSSLTLLGSTRQQPCRYRLSPRYNEVVRGACTVQAVILPSEAQLLQHLNAHVAVG